VTSDPLNWLFDLAQFGIKFGLHNMLAIMAELDHPERRFSSVHVAGTNGKGSVTAMVETALRAGGLHTGRYTSPHLLDLSERFALDGQPVSQEEMLSTASRVRSAVERLRDRGTLEVHPTFFEVTTAMAFEIFSRHHVDVAVCEVGLGGRLDATNVLSPMACAITSIGFDHEQYLGRTLRDIAGEKAGIVKPATPVVVGPVDREAAAAIQNRAAECGAPLVWAMSGVTTGRATAAAEGQQFTLQTPVRDYGEVRCALAGDHQVSNAIVSVRLLEELERLGVQVDAQAVQRGLATVSWPGRLQHISMSDGREAILDAAHNEDGAIALARYLQSHGPRRVLVFAAMRDKDARSILAALAHAIAALVVTRASNPRSAEPDELATLARDIAPELPVEVAATPADAIASAWRRGSSIAIAGSIFLVADAMKVLGRS
jgi:dihydrofolate synthase/folylpolyglutamate synthase